MALNNRVTLKKFTKHNRFEYDLLVNAKKAAAKCGVYAWPTHMVINKKGTLTMLIVGSKNVDFTISDAIVEARR